MLQWEGDTYSAFAVAQFVHLRVGTYWGQTVRFRAEVELIYGKRLAYRNDIPTMDEAKRWCEATYKKMLTAEIARLGTDPAAHATTE